MAEKNADNEALELMSAFFMISLSRSYMYSASYMYMVQCTLVRSL